jgi:hypothetical protein
MVSICGGEPLIYPKIEELIAGLLEQGRVLYICTNGMFMRKKMRDYLAAIYSPALEPKLKKLLDGKLISEKEAEVIRKSDDAAKKESRHPPDAMDVLERPRGRSGIHARPHRRARRRVQGMRRGHQDGEDLRLSGRDEHDGLSRNRRAEIEDMFKFLSSLEVDGHTISPGYDYDAAKKDMVSRLGRDPKEFFLTRDMTRQKFAKIQDWGKAFTIFGTPVYQEFLAGKRELTCTAWAIPTYNVKGWKAPCYLMTDGHYSGYQEMLTKVQWEKYGVVNGVARDPRCEHCMVHCGYDPSGALGTNYQSGDNWKNFKYNFGAKPKPYPASPELAKRAFNGVTIGKGHLAEAKAIINSPAAGARGAFSHKEESRSRGARRQPLRHEATRPSAMICWRKSKT